MQRYFMGSNTAHGFFSYYREDIARSRRAVLIKGGPGTGKSTLMRRIADECVRRGYDWEERYCSGDVNSLDAVYIKDTDSIILDATSPHAAEAAYLGIKESVIDLARGLREDALMHDADDICACINNKKRCYDNVYAHLNIAFCHYNNKLRIQSTGTDTSALRAFAHNFCTDISANTSGRAGRALFAEVISGEGASAYYDHLRGREIVKVTGSDYAKNVFFSVLAERLYGADTLRNPLAPEYVTGVIADGAAVVSDAGHMDGEVSESVDLNAFSRRYDHEACAFEEEALSVRTGIAKNLLDHARALHKEAERHYISAMDFSYHAEAYARAAEILL